MISLAKAKEALIAAEKKAAELGVMISTVVVDEHGSIIAVSRMDGALYISPKFALTKAYTSANLGAPTDGLAGYVADGKPYYGLNTLFGGELTTIAGGMPVSINGKVEGAVGVGGSMDVSQDALCAKEAAAVLQG